MMSLVSITLRLIIIIDRTASTYILWPDGKKLRARFSPLLLRSNTSFRVADQ